MIDYADIIVDLQAGDTGKGKVAHALAKLKDEYTHVVRYNGGGNAGHTVYHNGEKFVTHFIPVGVLYGIKSIIGPGCVVNVDKLFQEMLELEFAGIEVRKYLFIDERVNIIKPEHVEEDSKDTEIGTTKTGNGPAYRDKYYRKGLRAVDEPRLSEMVIDIYEEFHRQERVKILFEGAQGFELDIDWGDYPYVTSSHCTVGSAILNGVPPHKVREIYGVAKAYRTYVGAKKFSEDLQVFQHIREAGNEFGATTGRPRQVNWLDMDDLIKATNINGVTKMIINKMDILEQLNVFKLVMFKTEYVFDTTEEFQEFITDNIRLYCPSVKDIKFSLTPFDI